MLVVSGEPAELADLRTQIRGEYSDGTECLFDFNAVLPVPDPEPYNWRRENWGTDRLPSYCDIEEDGSDGEFFIRFETTNVEPRGVVAALSGRYTDLWFELEHNTPDWDLGGRWVFAHGEVVEEEWWSGDDDEVEDDPEVEDNGEDGGSPVSEDEVPVPQRLEPRLRPSSLADGMPSAD